MSVHRATSCSRAARSGEILHRERIRSKPSGNAVYYEFFNITSEIRGEMGEMRDEINEMRDEINEIRGEINEIRGEISEIRGEINEFMDEISGIMDEISEMRGDQRLDGRDQGGSDDIEGVSIDFWITQLQD